MKKRKIRYWGLAALPAILLLLLGSMRRDNADGTDFSVSPTESNLVEESLQEEKTVFVHIGGQVMKPGVYEVKADSRVVDVLLLAGGFTAQASTDEVNMAQRVEDGMKIIIPAISAEDGTESLVNLNTATKEQLMSLPGIGESKAQAILSYRKKNGGFSGTEEVMQVEGIKAGVYEKIKEYIIVR